MTFSGPPTFNWQGFDNNAKAWTLNCPSGTDCSNFQLDSPPYNVLNLAPQAGCSCDPLFLVFNATLTGVAPLCSGTVTITITG